MKTIVAIQGSPREGWNTDLLVRAAADGAAAAGAAVQVIDLYRLAPYTGCVSCFGCKTPGHLGTCIHPDGLADVLQAIRRADGLILGSPVYLVDISAGMRALFERLIFQYISYKAEPRNYSTRKIPVLLLVTSNVAAAGNDALLQRYRGTLEALVGPTQTFACGMTMPPMAGRPLTQQSAGSAVKRCSPGNAMRCMPWGRQWCADVRRCQQPPRRAKKTGIIPQKEKSPWGRGCL